MSDLGLRLLVVGGVVVVVALSTLAARRYGSPHLRPVDVDGLDLPPGLVVFTSTTCATCRRALGAAKATGAPLREITYELEAATFERAGVGAVPLTLVIGGDGEVVDQVGGVPRPARLRRALARGDR
jgi:hypothetical protein